MKKGHYKKNEEHILKNNGSKTLTQKQKSIIFVICSLLCFTPTILFSLSLNGAEHQLLSSLNFDKNLILEIKQFVKKPFHRFESPQVSSNPLSLDFRKSEDFNKGISFNLNSEQVKKTMEKYYKPLKQKGYLLFISQRNHGFSLDQISLIKSSNQFDILKIQKTSGPNYNNTNSDVINKMKKWHQTHPFEIQGANYNWLEARLIYPPKNPLKLAKEIYEICPDIVNIHNSNIKALAKTLEESKILYLWWKH